MKKRRSFSFLVSLLSALLLTSGAMAMSSSTYRLDRLVPLDGSGGPASSANYSVNLTLGQTGVNISASPHFQSCLGYWCERTSFTTYLLELMKS